MSAPASLVNHHTRRYIGALFLVGIMSAGAWWILGSAIHAQDENAHIINVAGRQRMLSQRLPLLVQSPPNRADFEHARRLMAEANQALLRKDISTPCSRLVGPDRILAYQGLRQDVRTFLSNLEAGTPGRLIEEASELLPRLDAFVSEVEQASERQLKWLHTLETLLFLATLGILGLEALIIFRPLTKVLRRALRSEQQARSEAEQNAAQLRVVLDAIGDGILIANRDGRIEEVRSRHIRTWFPDIKVGDRLETISSELRALPEPGKSLHIATSSTSAYEVRTQTLGERRLVVMRDESAQHRETNRVARELESVAAVFLDDEELYIDFRTDVASLSEALSETHSHRDRAHVLMLLHGALSGVGFDSISERLNRVKDRLETGDLAVEECGSVLQALAGQLERLDAIMSPAPR